MKDAKLAKRAHDIVFSCVTFGQLNVSCDYVDLVINKISYQARQKYSIKLARSVELVHRLITTRKRCIK